MNLTRFEINPARRGARRLLASAQAMHAAVLAGFPRGANAGPGRTLWRVDRTSRGTYLYVVSGDAPDFTHLIEQAGWPTTSTWETRSYDGLLNSLETSQQWMFRLSANPAKSTRLGAGTRSQRVGHVTAAQQLEWLLARTEGHGFRPTAHTVDGDGRPDVTLIERETLRFGRRASDGGSRSTVTITRATFEGRLEVLDADTLRHALTGGIGPAKAYGCGMLTLAPVP